MAAYVQFHRHDHPPSPLPNRPKDLLSRVRAARDGDRAANYIHPDAPINPTPDNLAYVRVRGKFALALLLSLAWLAFTIWIALPWMRDLARLINWPVALLIIGGIALVPGVMNAFLAASLLLDRRPRRAAIRSYPPVSILIAAFNEAHSIEETLRSLALQDYPGVFEAIVIDDGSSDLTARILAKLDYPWLHLIRQESNLGKAAALNRGLILARHDLILTLDGDSYLFKDALRN